MGNSERVPHRTGLEVAIVGMAGRFPGARNVDEFWRNLRDGVESITFFSDEELEAAGIEPALIKNPNYVKACGVLQDVDMFDAPLIGYSPREAEVLNPQHRQFLECAWEALEHAGYDPAIYKGLIGVYAGAGFNLYLVNIYSNPELVESMGTFQVTLSNDKDFLATQVSYKLNLRGPSVTVQSACSSSLVAVHMACQALLSGSCDIALAGGAGISAEQKSGYYYQEAGILSPDGHCRAFDAKARGTVGGNGVGIVVLKRLEDAIEDRDTVYAIIKGSAINNDGSLKVGFTAPSVEGQARVIRAAQLMAEVHPETITYVEAHGSGTELGDPIEVAALTRAFGARTQKKGYCALGSVKTNIGHLDTASGVASLIKAALALKHGQIPPSLNYEEANPKIDFGETPFYVNSKLKDWETGGELRRAGVSSFGIGGTNAHVVLEEMREVRGEQEVEGEKGQQVRELGERGEREWKLVVMSGQSEEGLERVTERLCEHLSEERGGRLEDIAYTLQVGRRRLNHRRVVVCRDVADAAGVLRSRDPRRMLSYVTTLRDRPVAFIFPGLGDHYVNMGLGLYNSYPAFRSEVDRCCRLLTPHLGFDLLGVLYPRSGAGAQAAGGNGGGGQAKPDLRRMLGRVPREGEGARLESEGLSRTVAAQPAVFVVEYALARLLMSWGVEPEAMIGYSLGEYVAACLAGVMKLEDALYLVARRAGLIERLPGGGMLAVAASEREIEGMLAGGVSVAAVNGPAMCVVAGEESGVRRMEEELTARGVVSKRLATRHAFHSGMMEEIREEYEGVVREVELSAPTRRYVSNVSGDWVGGEEVREAGYWARHMCEAVRYGEGMEKVLEGGERIVVEVGPGQVLSSLVVQQGREGVMAVATMRSMYEESEDDARYLETGVGRIWLGGGKVDWEGYHSGEKRRRVALPTYPFQRQRYWVERQRQTDQVKTGSTVIRKKPDIADWFYVPSWKRSLTPVTRRSGELNAARSCRLVFMDPHGLGSRIVDRLEKGDQDVVRVMPGEKFSRRDDSAFIINPTSRSDYHHLIKDLVSDDRIPETIIHLWNVTPVESNEEQSRSYQQSQETGFYSLLYLAQALGKEVLTNPIDIQVVTNNMMEVNGEEPLSPEKITLLGPCKVIPQEYPNITCRSIDVLLPAPGTQARKRLDAQLLSEVTCKPSDLVVAYRGSHRWVQTFEQVRPADEDKTTPVLRHGGVYLITGGLGLIGQVFAEYLAQTLQAKLVLVGRSPFPEKDKWAEYQAEADDPVSRKVRMLRGLEEAGAEVWVCNADVGDEAQMRKVIERTCERHGRIDGVIHAAGIVGDESISSIQETSEKDFELQSGAKIRGLYVLEKLLSGKDLDFCFLVSSLSCVLGGLGFVTYTAVNLFMDAFAYKQNRAGKTPWISVNWDGWRFNQAADGTEDSKGTWAQMGLTPSEGLQVFERVLSMGEASQVIISTGDLQARIDQWIMLESVRRQGEGEKKNSLSLHARPNLQNPYVAARNDIEEKLTAIWQGLLGFAEVGIHDSFFDLGGHSLIVVQLISRLRETFGVEVPLRRVFEAPTIAELALTVVNEQLGPAISEDDLVDHLSEVENLTESELEQLLAEEG